MYMGDIKLLAKNEKELETLIHTVRIYNQNIGMEFGIEKCVMLVIKSGKRHTTDGRELPNQDKIERSEKTTPTKTWESWRLTPSNRCKWKIKSKIKKEYLRRTRKLHETKLSSRNLVKWINTWSVPLVRYSGHFPKWNKDVGHSCVLMCVCVSVSEWKWRYNSVCCFNRM